MTASDYARQLAQLMPRGRLFRLDSDSVFAKLFLAIGEELARIDVRGEDLLREWSPATATDAECLGDWERVLGLPDPYLLFPPETEAGRQEAAAAKYIARGGQSRQYMIDLAAALGFGTVTIEDGVTPHVWTMHVDLTDYTGEVIDQEFEAGYSEAGDDLGGLYVEALELSIWRANPAHAQVYFDYST